MEPSGFHLPNSPWHPDGHSLPTDVTGTKELVGMEGGFLHGGGTAWLTLVHMGGGGDNGEQWGWALSSVTAWCESGSFSGVSMEVMAGEYREREG